MSAVCESGRGPRRRTRRPRRGGHDGDRRGLPALHHRGGLGHALGTRRLDRRTRSLRDDRHPRRARPRRDRPPLARSPANSATLEEIQEVLLARRRLRRRPRGQPVMHRAKQLRQRRPWLTSTRATSTTILTFAYADYLLDSVACAGPRSRGHRANAERDDGARAGVERARGGGRRPSRPTRGLGAGPSGRAPSSRAASSTRTGLRLWGPSSIWQANAAGRYMHPADAYDAPLDPNFVGSGQCRTDAQGVYRSPRRSVPGRTLGGNHPNAWRPAHIHLSVLGPALATRIVTQFYFPDDPLQAIDPIFQSVPAARARGSWRATTTT